MNLHFLHFSPITFSPFPWTKYLHKVTLYTIILLHFQCSATTTTSSITFSGNGPFHFLSIFWIPLNSIQSFSSRETGAPFLSLIIFLFHYYYSDFLSVKQLHKNKSLPVYTHPGPLCPCLFSPENNVTLHRKFCPFSEKQLPLCSSPPPSTSVAISFRSILRISHALFIFCKASLGKPLYLHNLHTKLQLSHFVLGCAAV